PGTDSQGAQGTSSIKVQGGVEYHFVVEFKSHNNQQGYLKMWINNVLAVNATNITTCTGDGNCRWSGIRFGGAAYAIGETAMYDQIRGTTTNLAPGSAASSAGTTSTAAPTTPGNLRVQ